MKNLKQMTMKVMKQENFSDIVSDILKRTMRASDCSSRVNSYGCDNLFVKDELIGEILEEEIIYGNKSEVNKILSEFDGCPIHRYYYEENEIEEGTYIHEKNIILNFKKEEVNVACITDMYTISENGYKTENCHDIDKMFYITYEELEKLLIASRRNGVLAWESPNGDIWDEYYPSTKGFFDWLREKAEPSKELNSERFKVVYDYQLGKECQKVEYFASESEMEAFLRTKRCFKFGVRIFENDTFFDEWDELVF